VSASTDETRETRSRKTVVRVPEMSMNKEQITLTEFLLARISDDEAASKRWDEKFFAAEAPDRSDTPFDPERILAECAAKRSVTETYTRLMASAREDPSAPPGKVHALEMVLRTLALPYAHHPDYRPEWSPMAPAGDG
jgi:Family of unknown function (DUF6221)